MSLIFSPLTAETAIGTSCRLSTRFCAVTTTSSSTSCWAWVTVPASMAALTAVASLVICKAFMGENLVITIVGRGLYFPTREKTNRYPILSGA